jgi:hypothetical protein
MTPTIYASFNDAFTGYEYCLHIGTGYWSRGNQISVLATNCWYNSLENLIRDYCEENNMIGKDGNPTMQFTLMVF